MRANSATGSILLAVSLALAVVGCAQATDESQTPSSTDPIVQSTTTASSISSAFSSTTTSEPATTTTTLDAPTLENLFTVFPPIERLPEGWTTPGGLPVGGFEPDAGPGAGVCGGPNAAGRAQERDVVEMISSPTYQSQGADISVAIFAFDRTGSAKGFMEASLGQAQCPGYPSYELVEDEDISLFLDGFGQGRSWTVSDSYAVGSSKAPKADRSFLVTNESTYSIYTSGTNYGQKEVSHSFYEQYGPLVLLFGVSSTCCYYGFNNTNTLTSSSVDASRAAKLVQALRPVLVNQLIRRNLIPA